MNIYCLSSPVYAVSVVTAQRAKTGAKAIQWRKGSLFNMRCCNNWLSTGEKQNAHLTSHLHKKVTHMFHRLKVGSDSKQWPAMRETQI